MSSRALLVDTTRAQPVWLTGAASSEGNVVRFRAESEHDYLVVEEDQVLRPVVRKAASAWLKRNDIDVAGRERSATGDEPSARDG